MKFVFVTGMSGAGKTIALKMLEDVGYYCVDNLPVELVPKFVELTRNSDRANSDAALGIDIRSGEKLADLKNVLKDLKNAGISYEILFLDADNETLIKRYKETRRSHPLAKNGRVEDGIREERKKLEFLKKQADYIIDTGGLLTRELKQELVKIFVDQKGFRNLFVTILSFGFMYGIPNDTDLLFDVRFLPNPFYEESMKMKTGEDPEVRDYVFSNGVGDQFLDKLTDMIRFLIPHYIEEGKTQLVIGIGCTGGQHRSVAVAAELSRRLAGSGDIGIKTEHRDIDRNRRRMG
jgi:UPF0042 nucleotide-binding protein